MAPPPHQVGLRWDKAEIILIFDRVLVVFVWLIGNVTIFTGVRNGAEMDAGIFFYNFGYISS